MTIAASVSKPTSLRALETDFGTSIAAGIWNKIAEMQKWVNESVPIGLIMHFHETQQKSDPGGPVDLPENTWQICDGGLVTDAESPLNGQNTPDLVTTSYRLKSGSAIGTLGGSTTHDLSHDHTGFTELTTDCDAEAALGFDLNVCASHNHSISNQGLIININTPFWDLQPFMRIK